MVVAGLQPAGGHLVCPAADLQGEVVQGAAEHCIRAVIQWLQGRHVPVPSYKDGGCAAEGVREVRRRLPVGGGVVAGGEVAGRVQRR